MSQEYGLGTQSIGTRPFTPFAITSLTGYGSVSAPLGVTYSYSSNVIGAANFTFIIEAGKYFPVGGTVWAVSQTSPSNWMYGTVTAYASTTLQFLVNAGQYNGSGTFSNWGIYLVSQPTVPSSGPILGGHLINVNVNSTGDVGQIAIASPTIYYTPLTLTVHNSGFLSSISNAQFGLFTKASKAGVALISSGAALSALTTNLDNSAGNAVTYTCSSCALAHTTPLYFNISTAQGSVATVDVYVSILSLPVP